MESVEPDRRRARRRREADPLAALRRLRPEREVQRAVMELLRRTPGVTFWRQNTRTITVPGKGGRPRPMFFGFPGLSDTGGWYSRRCRACVNGADPYAGACPQCFGTGKLCTPLYIECKRPVGARRSAEQIAFIDRVRADGGIAFFAHSVDDVVREFQARGIL